MIVDGSDVSFRHTFKYCTLEHKMIPFFSRICVEVGNMSFILLQNILNYQAEYPFKIYIN